VIAVAASSLSSASAGPTSPNLHSQLDLWPLAVGLSPDEARIHKLDLIGIMSNVLHAYDAMLG
jgi:hypothetical protein